MCFKLNWELQLKRFFTISLSHTQCSPQFLFPSTFGFDNDMFASFHDLSSKVKQFASQVMSGIPAAGSVMDVTSYTSSVSSDDSQAVIRGGVFRKSKQINGETGPTFTNKGLQICMIKDEECEPLEPEDPSTSPPTYNFRKYINGGPFTVNFSNVSLIALY